MQVNDPNIKVDHIDGNKLNCCRYNLRACTNQQNGFNTGTYKNNTSGVKGVSWNKNIKRWQPKIMVDGRTINLGVFKENEFELAVKARKDAEIKYFGEFRRENNEHI